MRLLILSTLLLAPVSLAQPATSAQEGSITTTSSLTTQGPYARAVRPPEILVSGYNSDAVHRFDPITGELLGTYEGIPGAQAIVLGADGLLYVCAEKVNKVVRIDPNTGQHVDDFVWDDPLTPGNETGSLNGPTSAIFGPGGHL